MKAKDMKAKDKKTKVAKGSGGVKVWQRELASLRGAVNIAEAIKHGEFAYTPSKGELALLTKSLKAQRDFAEKALAKNGWKIPSRLAGRIAKCLTVKTVKKTEVVPGCIV